MSAESTHRDGLFDKIRGDEQVQSDLAMRLEDEIDREYEEFEETESDERFFICSEELDSPTSHVNSSIQSTAEENVQVSAPESGFGEENWSETDHLTEFTEQTKQVNSSQMGTYEESEDEYLSCEESQGEACHAKLDSQESSWGSQTQAKCGKVIFDEMARFGIEDMNKDGDSQSQRETTVVNLKHYVGIVKPEYIGKQYSDKKGTWKESVFANPFLVGKDGNREQCLKKYEKHVRSSPEIWRELPNLKGKVLGCWCHPKPCHGDILIKLIRESEQKKGKFENPTAMMFEEYLCSLSEEEINNYDNDNVWSILTDVISYTHTGQVTEGLKVEAAKGTSSLKDRLGVQGENPEPEIKEKTFRADYCNEPNENDLDNRYENVVHYVRKGVNIDTDICATYLWSHENAKEKDQRAYFATGSFPITAGCMADGKIVDDPSTRMKVLLDTGASKPLIRQKFYNECEALQKYPKYKIPPRKVKTATGQCVYIDTVVRLNMQIGDHVFEFLALVMPMTADIDFILGAKAFCELEGDIDFSSLRFNFVMRSVPIALSESVSIHPGKTQKVEYEAKNLPENFHSGDVQPKLEVGQEGTRIRI